MKQFLEVALLSTMLVATSYSRTFTNADGRKMEGEMISATETHVVVKSLKNQRRYTIEISTLSEEDQRFIAERKGDPGKDAAELAGIEARRKVVGYAGQSLGKKIGNGECWTLADVAYKFAEIKRPGKDQRVWGRVVDWENEELLPGDILELRAAAFSDGNKSGPAHTAIVMKQGRGKGEVVVYHQNWGRPGKIVSMTTFDLNKLTSGKAMIYRYAGAPEVSK